MTWKGMGSNTRVCDHCSIGVSLPAHGRGVQNFQGGLWFPLLRASRPTVRWKSCYVARTQKAHSVDEGSIDGGLGLAKTSSRMFIIRMIVVLGDSLGLDLLQSSFVGDCNQMIALLASSDSNHLQVFHIVWVKTFSFPTIFL